MEVGGEGALYHSSNNNEEKIWLLTQKSNHLIMLIYNYNNRVMGSWCRFCFAVERVSLGLIYVASWILNSKENKVVIIVASKLQ